jgi:AcrR family transcriptional regulator
MARSSHGVPSADGTHETRKLILQVAQRLFMEQGYRTVSTRHIAATCGITQPALYRHFATKQDLYVAVLLEMLSNLRGRIMHLVERKESVPVRLHLIARVLPATWMDARQMFHDIEHELDAHHRQIMADAFQQQIISPMAALFAEGITQGLLRDSGQGGLDPQEATFVLLRLLDDQNTPGFQDRSRLQHADHMVDVLLRGLLKQTEANE